MVRLLVEALALSVPLATLVVRLKAALAALASPEVASPAVHAIPISPACHKPSDAAQETIGLVASRLMVTDCVLVPPELVAVQVNVTPDVSVVTKLVSQPDCDVMADSGSLTVQPTVTLLMYHPLFPRVPLTFEVMTGAVGSHEGTMTRL